MTPNDRDYTCNVILKNVVRNVDNKDNNHISSHLLKRALTFVLVGLKFLLL